MAVDFVKGFIYSAVAGTLMGLWAFTYLDHGTWNVLDVWKTLKSTTYRHEYVIQKSDCIKGFVNGERVVDIGIVDALCAKEAHTKALDKFCSTIGEGNAMCGKP